jgi:diguanylate cyclase (GGDEF)-like protein/PAS domain S-box-containing protein
MGSEVEPTITEARPSAWRERLPALLVAVLGGGLSIAAGLTIDYQERGLRAERALAERTTAATEVHHAVARQVALAQSAVRSVAALFEASERVTERELQTFCRPLLEARPEVWAVAWFPADTALEAPRYLVTAGPMTGRPAAAGRAAARALAHAGGADAPALDRPMVRAVAATRPVQAAFLQPVPTRWPTPSGSPASPAATPWEPTEGGTVVALVDPQRLLEEAMGGLTARGLAVELLQRLPGEPEHVLARHGVPSPIGHRTGRGAGLLDRRLPAQGGQWWLRVRAAARAAPAAGPSLGLPVALGGLLLMAILALYLGALQQHSSQFYWANAALSREVDARRRTEAVLRDSEARYRVIVESAADGILVVAADGTIASATDRALALFGYTEDQVLGRPVELLLPEALRAGHRHLREQFVADPQRRPVGKGLELQARRRDGGLFPVEVSLSPMHTDGGLQVTAIIADVSERAEAQRTRDRLAAVLDATPDLVGMATADGVYTYLNDAGRRLLGLTADEPLDGTHITRYVPERLGDWLMHEALAQAQAQGTWSGESLLLARDGREVPVSQVIVAHCGASGAVEYYSTIARDISARLAVEQALRRSEERFALAVRGTRDGIWDWDVASGEVFYSARFKALLGYTEDGFPHRFDSFESRLHRDDREPVLAAVRRHLEQHVPFDVEMRLCTRDRSYRWFQARGQALWDGAGRAHRMAGSITDITERRAYQAQLEHQANHDPLTGLPNRNLLRDRLERAVAHAERQGRHAAVVFLDVDGFKYINDALGHDAGDELLKAVARRLAQCVRGQDTVARHGGDELALVLTDLRVPEEATAAFARVRGALAAPIRIAGRELAVSLSAGVAVHPRDGADPSTLLRNADAALSRAKEREHGSLAFYTAELNQRAEQRLHLEVALRQALEQETLEVHYQPKVDLASGAIVGFEALLRWTHPDLGQVSPARFIPLAEQTGLIAPLGEWVLRQVCRQVAEWTAEGLEPGRVAVNVSAQQLADARLAQVVARTLAETGASAARLELELTESEVMDNAQAMVDALQGLKALGLSLAMDDFGTGYSSLAYLRRFAFDWLKIDRAFVTHITSDPDQAAIARTVLAMAASLRLGVVAEGVETRAQAAYLQRLGCGQAQGFLYSPAVPAAEAEALLRAPPDWAANEESCEQSVVPVEGDAHATLGQRAAHP